MVAQKWLHVLHSECFDIGKATKEALVEFERRQNVFAQKYNIPPEQMDSLNNLDLLKEFNVHCSRDGVAGNGALMRLAPVPLFFQKNPIEAVAFSGFSGVISHGDRIAFDACRYYGALIVAAVQGMPKEQLLDKEFYVKYEGLFSNMPIHPDIMKIANGSYQEKGGYDKGIRGKGYIVSALEAALWAFWSTDSFEDGVLAAVNLGDDTDTTAAIYGQLAGAYYGYKILSKKWVDSLYAIDFILCLSKWIVYEGQRWQPEETGISTMPPFTFQLQPKEVSGPSSEPKENRKESTPKSAPHIQTDTTGTLLYNTAAHEATGCGSGSNQHSLHYLRSISSILPLNYRESLQSCNDVSHWLRQLGGDYAAYVGAFERNCIDGFWLLNYIDDQDLRGMEIKNEAHRRVILDNIQQLKGTSSVKF